MRIPLSSRRVRRHILLALLAAGMIAVLFLLFGQAGERWVDNDQLKASSTKWRLSMALAYSALSFLVATLLIGPFHVARRGSRPANQMMRRDVGIWSGMLALAHVSIGLLVHADGFKIWGPFITGLPGPGNWLPLRYTVFGLANYAGLLQAGLMVLLLLISNQVALRRLGVARWKGLQRLTYAATLSILIHGLAFQSAEARGTPIRIAFLLLISLAVTGQLIGVLLVLRGRRQRVRRG